MKLNIKIMKILGIGLVMSMSLVGCSQSTEAAPEENYSYEKEVSTEAERKEEYVPDTKEEVILIQDDYFVEDMDKIFTDLEAYVGRTIQYEGFISQIDEEQYAVTRYYDMEHEGHGHEILVGLETVYDGTWPEENTWVEITGIIQDKTYEAEVVPIVKVTQMNVKENRGQEKVTN